MFKQIFAFALFAVVIGPSLAFSLFNLFGGSPKSIYEFTVKDLDGKEVSLEKYRGHPLLIVNVASHCALTNINYRALNDIYKKYNDQGLRILAFPSNQFYQEPGTPKDIKKVLQEHKVEFDVFGKVLINGKDAHPLYQYLKSKQGGWLGNDIKWNFTKFLVNKEGVPVARYAPTTNPASLDNDIRKLL